MPVSFMYTNSCNCTGYIAGHSQSCYLYLVSYNQCIADFLEANVNK